MDARRRRRLQQQFSGHKNFIVAHSLKLIDDTVACDPVKFRRFVEPVPGGAGPNAPQIIYPAWPGSYLVDLTGLNANVALELGITHTLGRRTLIVTQDSAVEKYFSAIGKTRMHRYSLSGEPGLNSLLDRFLAEHD